MREQAKLRGCDLLWIYYFCTINHTNEKIGLTLQAL